MAAASQRFWSKVNTTTEGCWLWIGSKSKKRGYGSFHLNGSEVGAHCAAWILSHGPIPSGLYVCHECDNPSCVRPDHLFLGTNRDNQMDAASKGRSRGGVMNGTRNGRAKLTSNDVIDIRTIRENTDLTLKEIGALFHIGHNQVWKITTGQQRKYL